MNVGWICDETGGAHSWVITSHWEGAGSSKCENCGAGFGCKIYSDLDDAETRRKEGY